MIKMKKAIIILIGVLLIGSILALASIENIEVSVKKVLTKNGQEAYLVESNKDHTLEDREIKNIIIGIEKFKEKETKEQKEVLGIVENGSK